ncbi:hypothetical protein Bbelb_256740 [Branchiostoma belcheri]|nr:hypothetical protein Bbelb_256740 [Branchiostoma belcheri]
MSWKPGPHHTLASTRLQRRLERVETAPTEAWSRLAPPCPSLVLSPNFSDHPIPPTPPPNNADPGMRDTSLPFTALLLVGGRTDGVKRTQNTTPPTLHSDHELQLKEPGFSRNDNAVRTAESWYRKKRIFKVRVKCKFGRTDLWRDFSDLQLHASRLRMSCRETTDETLMFLCGDVIYPPSVPGERLTNCLVNNQAGQGNPPARLSQGELRRESLWVLLLGKDIKCCGAGGEALTGCQRQPWAVSGAAGARRRGNTCTPPPAQSASRLHHYLYGKRRAEARRILLCHDNRTSPKRTPCMILPQKKGPCDPYLITGLVTRLSSNQKDDSTRQGKPARSRHAFGSLEWIDKAIRPRVITILVTDRLGRKTHSPPPGRTHADVRRLRPNDEQEQDRHLAPYRIHDAIGSTSNGMPKNLLGRHGSSLTRARLRSNLR